MTSTPHSPKRGMLLVVAAAVQAVLLSGEMTVRCIAQDAGAPPADIADESIPSPPNATVLNGPELPKECSPAPTDKPLWTLDTDIRPRTRNGELFTTDKLPFSCASLKPIEQRMMSVESSASCCPHYSGLLNLARFCHRPLYFNDDCLERCGIPCCCCQPAASAACFYGGALLMPVRAFCQCPCSCVPSGGCCP